MTPVSYTHLCGLLGRIRPEYDLAILEIDERSAPRIYPYVKPEHIVITNLFRDSIMRHAHPGYIAAGAAIGILKFQRCV